MRTAPGHLDTVQEMCAYMFVYSCVFSCTDRCIFFHPCLLLAPPSQQKEKKVTMTAEEGHSTILKCNPPQSSMQPIIHWMDWSECIIFPSLPPLHTSCLVHKSVT